jgi:hypothetical protein
MVDRVGSSILAGSICIGDSGLTTDVGVDGMGTGIDAGATGGEAGANV